MSSPPSSPGSISPGSPGSISSGSSRYGSPVKQVFASLKRLMSNTDSDEPYNKRLLDEEIQKNLENTRNLEQCKSSLSKAYSDLVDMDVKLFTTRAKMNRFLQEHVNQLIQDLVKENTQQQSTILLLQQENKRLLELIHQTPAMTELDELVKSIQTSSP